MLRFPSVWDPSLETHMHIQLLRDHSPCTAQKGSHFGISKAKLLISPSRPHTSQQQQGPPSSLSLPSCPTQLTHRAPTGATLGLLQHASTHPFQGLCPGCSHGLEHPCPRTHSLSLFLWASTLVRHCRKTPSLAHPTELRNTCLLPACLRLHFNPPSK